MTTNTKLEAGQQIAQKDIPTSLNDHFLTTPYEVTAQLTNSKKIPSNFQALLIRPTTESSDTKSQPGTYASPNALGSRLYQGELFRQRRGYLRKLVRNTKVLHKSF